MVFHKPNKYWHIFIPKSYVCLFREKYTASIFKKDLVAGITVGIVALPLAMAFAIASGVSPERGLFTAIVAGLLISLFGGSRVQIGGPTGAFVVIIYDIIQREGYSGLVIATVMAALLLAIMGFAKLGTLIKYIPYPLVIGFTTGIAVIIFSSQVKDFLGLRIDQLPSDFLSKWKALFTALPTVDPWILCVSFSSLICILLVRRFIPVIPWGIAAIGCATLICWMFSIPVPTIADRYGEIPRILPFPSIPHVSFSIAAFKHLIPDAVVIAFLAGIESLLSAMIGDRMLGCRHKSNCELIAQSIGNLGAIFFGGIPATGAIARTATNVKMGAKTPVAGIIHAATLFFIIVVFAPVVSLIPLPALSAVLIMIAWNMSEISHFIHLLRAPFGDIAVLLIAFLLTILTDLTVAIGVGMILAVFIFMKRMSDRSHIVPVTAFPTVLSFKKGDTDKDATWKKSIPLGVEIYNIHGPLFFGVADSLHNLLKNMEKFPKIFILRMQQVPVIDATGLYALYAFAEECEKKEMKLVLSEVNDCQLKMLINFGVERKIGKDNIFSEFEKALSYAEQILELQSYKGAS